MMILKNMLTHIILLEEMCYNPVDPNPLVIKMIFFIFILHMNTTNYFNKTIKFSLTTELRDHQIGITYCIEECSQANYVLPIHDLLMCNANSIRIFNYSNKKVIFDFVNFNRGLGRFVLPDCDVEFKDIYPINSSTDCIELENFRFEYTGEIGNDFVDFNVCGESLTLSTSYEIPKNILRSICNRFTEVELN